MDLTRNSSQSNKTIPPITGTTANTLLLSVHLLYPIQCFTPTVFHLQTTFLQLTIIHLKQQPILLSVLNVIFCLMDV